MTERKAKFVEEEFYHIYNRGNSKQIIFINDQDRERFIKLLYLCNSLRSVNFRDDIIDHKIDAWDFDTGEHIVSIGAWVLMPNHFHLLMTIKPSPKSSVGEKTKENTISYFLRKVCTSYVKYFNKKYGRIGGLFESNFKSNLINTDEYSKYIFSYIHLNPIKLIDKTWKESGLKSFSKAQEFLKDYKWSSYYDYSGIKRPENIIISPKDFPEYFSDPKIFKEEIFDWLSFNDNKIYP